MQQATEGRGVPTFIPKSRTGKISNFQGGSRWPGYITVPMRIPTDYNTRYFQKYSKCVGVYIKACNNMWVVMMEDELLTVKGSGRTMKRIYSERAFIIIYDCSDSQLWFLLLDREEKFRVLPKNRNIKQ